jgi:hypothetical protein
MHKYLTLSTFIVFFCSSLVMSIFINPQASYGVEDCSGYSCNQADTRNSNSEEVQTYTVTAKSLIVREGPGRSYRGVKQLDEGTTIQGIEKSGWIQMLDGNYISANPNYVKVVSQIASSPDSLPSQTNSIDYNLIIAAFGTSLVMGISIAYNVGKSSGFSSGLSFGEKWGYDKGFLKGHTDGYEKASQEHTAVVVPICYTQDNTFFFFGTHQVKKGYFYQTYIKGMPSIKSEDIFIEITEESKIDTNELERLTKMLVSSYIALHPIAGVANSAIKIIDTKSEKIS